MVRLNGNQMRNKLGKLLKETKAQEEKINHKNGKVNGKDS